MLQRAVDDANAMTRSVTPDEMTKPTPCTDWDVSALIDHLAAACTQFTTALTGSTVEPPGESIDLQRSDLAGTYARTSQRRLDAWRTPGALERTLTMPFGKIPAAAGINIILADQLLHTWDLARALGRPCAMDVAAAGVALRMMQQMMRPEYRGPGQGFAEAVPCPESAPIQEQLVAFSGWRP